MHPPATEPVGLRLTQKTAAVVMPMPEPKPTTSALNEAGERLAATGSSYPHYGHQKRTPNYCDHALGGAQDHCVCARALPSVDTAHAALEAPVLGREDIDVASRASPVARPLVYARTLWLRSTALVA